MLLYIRILLQCNKAEVDYKISLSNKLYLVPTLILNIQTMICLSNQLLKLSKILLLK